MPIDPNIALQVRPVQAPDPVETFSRGMALKNMLQQQQMGDIQLEEAKQAQQDQQVLRELYGKSGGDLDQLQKMAAGKVSPKAMMTLNQAVLSQREKLSTIGKNELEVAKAHADAVAGAYEQLRQLPDEQSRASAYPGVVQSLTQAGHLTKDQAPAEYPGIQGLEQSIYPVLGAKGAIERALKQREAKLAEEAAARAKEKHAAELPGIQADTQTKQATAAGEAPIQPYQKQQLERMAMDSPTDLARIAADPAKPQAERDLANNALKLLEKHAQASRPVVNVQTQNDAKAIADAIRSGDQPPDLKGLYRYGAQVRAELARQGYNLTTAQRDWQAVQKHLSTLNGQQQERLRQAITFTYDSIDVIEDLYNQWEQKGTASGYKVLNRAALAFAKQKGGDTGAIAQSLEAQINDLVSELGTVYKGGNSSTDESLRLAAENLKGDWNPQQFRKQLDLIRKNLTIRKNSIMTSTPIGVSPNSPYVSNAGGTSNGKTGGGKPPLAAFEGK